MDIVPKENERKSEADASLESNKKDSMEIQKSEESKTTVRRENEANRDMSQIAFELVDQDHGLINQSVVVSRRDTANENSTLAPTQRADSIVDIVKKRLQTIKPYENAIKMLRKMPQL